MNDIDWRDLVVQTVTNPAQAARTLIEWRLRPDVVIMALMTACLINTVLLFGPRLALNLPIPMPAPLATPMPYFAVLTVGLTLLISVLHAVGRAMGGTGQLLDIAVVMIWLQIFGELVQVAVLILEFIFPFAALLLAVGISLYSVYIVLHFVNQAHNLASLGRSAAVLALTFIGIVFAVSLLLSLFGVGSLGEAASHV